MNDPSHIFAWLRLDDRTTTSGQPTEQQLAEIKALGVTHIINLALHSHEKALPDEAASVHSLGMTYIHIPVDFGDPTEDDFAQFCDVMEEIGENVVHVHCIVNARVSAFFYRYNREVKALSEPVARATMERIWKPSGVWKNFIGDTAADDVGVVL
ncbi:protein tyrosine phosphatase family protein [Parasphingorhabdus sp.]|uniref:protein tyrosine phosphatase family protein n=1 Tax=Parasphingorhabdus sp. TaxID=2709688 RepID=UPI002F92FE04